MPPRLRSSPIPSSVASCSVRPQSVVSVPARAARDFSQSSCRQITQRRRKFYEWLNGPGRALKEPLPSSTNYLGAYDRYGNLVRAGPGWQSQQKPGKEQDKAKEAGEADTAEKKEDAPEGQESSGDELDMAVRRAEEDAQAKKKNKKTGGEDRLPPETIEDLRPFPLNKYFRSQPVLSEDLREAIYQTVVREGKTVPLASVEFGVSNERVGAVVRLKQMEKEWVAKGKTLAIPYSKAVLNMLPTTPAVDRSAGARPIVHEPINDLIVHPATRQQLFVPVSESRRFTREDAGKAFDNTLLPADLRIPHPELVRIERDDIAGYSHHERRALATARAEKVAAEKKRREDEAREAEHKALRTVPQRRWDFVFRDVSVDSVGPRGRSEKGVGWRYGLPHQDRKKDQVKIPTKVEA